MIFSFIDVNDLLILIYYILMCSIVQVLKELYHSYVKLLNMVDSIVLLIIPG